MKKIDLNEVVPIKDLITSPIFIRFKKFLKIAFFSD